MIEQETRDTTGQEHVELEMQRPDTVLPSTMMTRAVHIAAYVLKLKSERALRAIVRYHD